MKILVLAAHPDDEVLGMGGTIRKLTNEKNTVHLCVITEGASAQYSDQKMIKIRKESCKKSAKILGIKKIEFLEFQDMTLDSIPQIEINKKIEKIIKKFDPEIIFTTSDNDLNKDHQKVFESSLIVSRPYSSNVKKIYAYEIPSINKTDFSPNVYFDITKEFKKKIEAFKAYKSEIEKFPHPRSVKYLESLAHIRGSQAGLEKAEGFRLIKSIKTK